MKFGYEDPELVDKRPLRGWRILVLLLAIMFICGLWFALNQKLLLGSDWLSPTYDNPDWRTNEGDLRTYGMWDLEAHVWKTEYIMEHFPHSSWNPYWYLGMPLLKYYQSGFYIAHGLTILLTGASPARAALLLIIFSHLLATLITFLLYYKMSRRIWAAALTSSFLLMNTFITLRSYGWEPITVVFLWLFPLGLYLFLKEPTKPFRFSMLLVMVLAYLCHPLLFFSLCMFMGLYLFSIAIRKEQRADKNKHYIWHYFGLVFASILVGAVQFFPQSSYHQVTSGAHMGVKYLPFYQVPPNIIGIKDFLFDAGNLKGPGPVIMIAMLLLVVFYLLHRRQHKEHTLLRHEMAIGFTWVLAFMVLFYYLEAWNVFPMNLLRSIQYHRIIPEFIIVAGGLVVSLSTILQNIKQKVFYYTMLVAFVLASFIIVYNIQDFWQTTPEISQQPEFIHEEFPGRLTVPYTTQSVAVRNSFTNQEQVYGYYEQGITNAYNDEIMSVSSGFHNANLTVLYLKAANVGRIYVNNDEGNRDRILQQRLQGIIHFENLTGRYSYFEVPLANPGYAQAVDGTKAAAVSALEPGCRELFKVVYCGSEMEEFVSTDPAEIAYLEAYVSLLEEPYKAGAEYQMENGDHYNIDVTNADENTAIVIKMTHDKDFRAIVDGKEVAIEKFGPDFMLVRPQRMGNYTLQLQYRLPREIFYGAIVSVVSLIAFIIYFIRRDGKKPRWCYFKNGDMQ